MSSTKASSEGRSLIKQAIAQKGWRVRDDRWLVAASYLLEPDGDWRPDGPYAYGCSMQTWERFLQGVVVRDRSFIAFCTVLKLHPNEVAETISLSNRETGDIVDTYDRSLSLEQKDFGCPLVQALLSRVASLEHRVSHLESQLSEPN